MFVDDLISVRKGGEMTKTNTILITGGSTGIGLATAARFADAGYQVFITGRNRDRLEAAANRLGERVHAIVADVSKREQMQGAINEIRHQTDTLDAVFANAGVAVPNKLGETSDDDFEYTFGINVRGVFNTVQESLGILRDGGSIVLNASIVANKGMAGMSLYSASKAAVRSFARTWANDLKPRQIRVNALSPGPVETPILETGLKMSSEDMDEFKGVIAQVSPTPRMGRPDEIASAVFFLASAEASYVNGIELSVDGGFAQI